MSGLLDFFTKEAGQKRRAWLDEKDAELTGLLSYFAGPHASDAAGKAGGLLATMSDAADFQDYTDASRATMRDPNLGNLAALATAGTALMIPGVSARMAEGAVDFGHDVARFRREEDGAIRAFHGSPHDFDKFSMDKIGTGEGAQAYGHGLYFAESEGVAKSYRDQLAQNTFDGGKPNWDDPQDLAAYWAGKAGMTTAPTRADRVSAANWLDGSDDAVAVEARRILLSDEPLKQLGKAQGHMYEVNINADPADFLDWDAPLSEQPERVKGLLGYQDPIPEGEEFRIFEEVKRELGPGNEGKISDDPRIQAIYQRDYDRRNADFKLQQMFNRGVHDPADVESLRNSGIPGIKYRDAMSRDGAGEGTRNYVVFDDNLIDIVRKYGWAAALPLLSQQQDNRDTQ